MIGPLRDRRRFQELRSSGRRLRRGPLTVTYVPLDPTADGPLVAFAIGRRFGPAVTRNRARRRLREAFRHVASDTGPVPVALLVQARPEVLERPFADLCADVGQVLAAVAPSERRP